MDLPVASPSACIQQAAHYEPTAIERMSVGQGGGLVRVPQRFLSRANAIAAHQQMRGAAVAERVATGLFRDARQTKKPGQRANASNITENSSLTRFLRVPAYRGGLNPLRKKNVPVAIPEPAFPVGATSCRYVPTSLYMQSDMQGYAAETRAHEVRGRMCYTESAYHRYRGICPIYC